MPTRKKPPVTVREWLLVVISCCTIGALLLMLIPLHVGLSAGIGSVSLVIFGIFVLLLISGVRHRDLDHPRVLMVVIGGVVASLVGLIVPQLFYYRSATDHNAHLSFQPGAYIRFSGETTITPDQTFPYKQSRSGELWAALYRAKPGQDRNPTIVLLHGGGWRYGNYLETGEWPRILTDAGYNVISVQYRLATESMPSWDKAPRDIHDAMVYIHSNAQRLGVAEDQIHLMGQSAGGHLALLEAYREGGVVSAVSLYSPIDLALDYKTSVDKSAELNFIGARPDENPQRYRDLSPINHVSARTPPTLLVQGQRDDLVAPANATSLSDELTKNHIANVVVLLPFTGHSFENQHGGFATQIAEQTVLRFLSNY